MRVDPLDVGYFRLAKNISKNSDHRVKMGCVIAKKKPVSAASNKSKTHTRCNYGMSNSTHAEIRALINCGCDDLVGGVAYIYREKKNGSYGLARPCNHCYEALKSAGIKGIYYTVENFPYWKYERVL